ncbi:MAG: response regulator [Oligoflexales bacterium]
MRGLLRGRWKKALNNTKQHREKSIDESKTLVKEREKKGSTTSEHKLSVHSAKNHNDTSSQFEFGNVKERGENIDLEPSDITHSSNLIENEEQEIVSTAEKMELSPGPRVLVLDDDNQILEIVGNIILSVGGVPLKALNGAHAMEWVEVDNIQLVLLDLHMPEMNGVDFLKGVRRIGALSNIPIFILTGRPDKNILEKLKPLGVHGCIVKPFHPDDLKDMIARYLSFSDNREAV